MKKQIVAVAVAGLFSIGAFAQASTPADASSQAEPAAAPAVKHHHKKKHHKRAHHKAASAVSSTQDAPSNNDAAPVKP